MFLTRLRLAATPTRTSRPSISLSSNNSSSSRIALLTRAQRTAFSTLLTTTIVPANMPRRKASGADPSSSSSGAAPPPPAKRITPVPVPSPASARRASSRAASRASAPVNPDTDPSVVDAAEALRASPGADANAAIARVAVEREGSAVDEEKRGKGKGKRKAKSVKVEEEEERSAEGVLAGELEAEAEAGMEVDEEEAVRAALGRRPPVHSDYLPLPWKGRLGYACLNTYLRFSTPPVFSSRTCRIASILEHRHPLKDPSQPEHATKNRPDREQPADVARGQEYVQSLGLANARDIIKMVRWNERYGIRFMRLSSEMFPFASHEEYGYTLAPFAAETLAEAGKVIAELGHRVTTHPGQFTQLGSPRQSVIDNAIRDLIYHEEMLSLLKLPEQQNRDAVMILHLGGVFGDKAATIERFKANYARLSPAVKARLVLENDDVSWHVHDLLPICQELNIPLVLDFHHHNILFDSSQLREGTEDIRALFPAIRETWTRKGITQKMHYSEPTPAAITPTQRRKHNPRPATLPPCPDDMDLMIEAKDKEQAVFELMRNFRLPGWNRFNDMIPHVRNDDNRPRPVAKKAAPKRKTKKAVEAEAEAEADADADADVKADADSAPAPPAPVPEEEVGMGGPDRRVYWPPGMEDWLRPAKRVIAPKAETGAGGKPSPAQKRKQKAEAEAAAAEAEAAADGVKVEVEEGEGALATGTKRSAPASKTAAVAGAKAKKAKTTSKAKPKPKSKSKGKTKDVSSEDDDDEKEAELEAEVSSSDAALSDLGSGSEDVEMEELPTAKTKAKAKATATTATGGRRSARARKGGRVSYKEEE